MSSQGILGLLKECRPYVAELASFGPSGDRHRGLLVQIDAVLTAAAAPKEDLQEGLARLVDPSAGWDDRLSNSEHPAVLRDEAEKTSKRAAARRIASRILSSGLVVPQDVLRDALEGIGQAEDMLSDHIEKHHDGDFEPQDIPEDLASLRDIQHHLAGSLIGENGEPLLLIHGNTNPSNAP